jgi:hypothetical protein
MNRWRPTVEAALSALDELYPTMTLPRRESLARLLATAPAIRLRHVVVGRRVDTDAWLMIRDPDFHLRRALYDVEDGLVVLDRVRAQILAAAQRPSRVRRSARGGRR